MKMMISKVGLFLWMNSRENPVVNLQHRILKDFQIMKMLAKRMFPSLITCSSKAAGILAPLTIPPAHIAALYYFWPEFSRDVDKRYCSCSCWDTVFKGSYESGVASYKHMYFNATANTIKIWFMIVVGIIIFYESVKDLAWLAMQCRLRFRMLILFGTAVFSHYYSWWVYINYWNDEFYSQWYHQLFFTATELLSTILVVHLADAKNPITHRKAFGIAAIAIMHILAGSWDQFITNVVRGEGYSHQVIRDLGFMIPDILHVAIPLWSVEWRNAYGLPGAGSSQNIRRDLTCISGMVIIGLCFCAAL
ncbi:uncharacterized protein [Neodiprion pinetum]|uniref:Uncharacterized protein LOC107226381 n=2 Tax=Neodiprion TaxID=270857 RepID=A0ABM3FPL9_NEOLC|nr:uncharacterized protein LOC124179069 isoform X1 [Neodiprion fabricii]XP_046419044.1 uncharacterized protein LOC124179069 isoform X1 [Neodiprion fabricii]XP_046472092.1 uncharacterized protein LOC124214115 isoform X1 [Neodiprion pinetum]XP_046472093.1 uncharacterized protein LOC124214115 isoform X1 [Neodiprion pinetum]XP_046589938.1 uncharacterized protein LOC107226381 [Neodiprion lecontei]